jgi:hypothetical protein
MSFGFRVCFVLPDVGSLSSDKEFIPFEAHGVAHPLKLSSGVAGVEIGKTDRFSIPEAHSKLLKVRSQLRNKFE